MQQSINPANGEVLREYPLHTDVQVNQMIDQSYECFQKWRRVPLAQRTELLLKANAVLLANKEKYGRIISEEMGKTLKEAVTEVEKCASAAKYFAESGPGFLADQHIKTEYRKSYISFQPLGIILGVMPWNFPFWQVLRYAFPALLGGNVCMLKHLLRCSFPEAALLPSLLIQKLLQSRLPAAHLLVARLRLLLGRI